MVVLVINVSILVEKGSLVLDGALEIGLKRLCLLVPENARGTAPAIGVAAGLGLPLSPAVSHIARLVR